MNQAKADKVLRGRYSKERGWVAFSELGVRRGAGSGRVDFLAFGIFQSTGLELHGIEVKASRSDWLRELADPGKAGRSWLPFCDRWFLAVPDRNIVKDGELPAGWGLLVLGSNVRTAVEAEKRSASPMGAHQIAALFARFLDRETSPSDEALDLAKAEAKREALNELRAEIEKANSLEVKKAMKAMEQIKEWEEASGLEFPAWYGGRQMGEDFKRWREMDKACEWTKRELRALAQSAARTEAAARSYLEDPKPCP